MATTTIEDRVILLLQEQMSPTGDAAADGEGHPNESLWRRWSPPLCPGRGFWEKLAEITGTPSQRWRSVFTRRQKPTLPMIERLAQIWPHYGFWLVTGITDATNGHVAPRTALTFPERIYSEDHLSTAYFRQLLHLMEQDQNQGSAANTGALPAGHIAGSSAYSQLIATWESRERERTVFVARLTGANRPWEPAGAQAPDCTPSQWDLFYRK